jgi:hypothetical protein
MKENSESVYGTSASPFPYNLPWGFCTAKENRFYLHVFDWPENGSIELVGLNNEIIKAYMMAEPDVVLSVTKDSNSSLRITLPDNAVNEFNSVVVLKISGDPDDIIDAGKSKIKGSVKSSKGWYEYKTENLGQLKIKRDGVHIIRLYPENNLDHYLMYFNSRFFISFYRTIYNETPRFHGIKSS